MAKWPHYITLMRLDKPIGILLLLWPTLWAFLIASQHSYQWHYLIIFIIGVVLMRSAGCVINDIADRHFDKAVKRTKNRPLATQKIAVREAFSILLLLLLLAASLLVFLKIAVFYLAIIALALAGSYPFMKRFIKLPQLVLGLAFAWGIPMVFVQLQSVFPMEAKLLFTLTFLWIVAYDTMYAMADKADDIKIGIYSSAIYFGSYDKIIIALLQLTVLLLWLVLAHYLPVNRYFYLVMLLAVGFFCYQQYLIKDRQEHACFRAFLNNNWYGLVMCLALLIGKY